MTTRAEFNNNPGNIRPAKGVKYEGLLGVDDKGFGIFESPEMGRKALEGDIRAKISSGKYNTPDSFIDRYTPVDPKEEGRDEPSRLNYKAYLMDQTGLSRSDEPFTEDHIGKLANAITAFEAGGWKFGQPAAQPDYAAPLAAQVPEVPSEGAPLASGEAQAKPFEIPEPIAGVAGGMLGAAGGAGTAVYKAKIDAAREAYDVLKSKVSPSTAADVVADVAPSVASEAVPAKTVSATSPEGSTPGGKWGAKTGYGIGEGSVEESSSRYKRAAPKGKVSSRLAKEWGIAKPGESQDLMQRMIDRANAEETKRLAERSKAARATQTTLAEKSAQQAKAAEQAMLLREAEQAAKAGQPSPLWSYARRLLGLPLKGAAYGAVAGLGGADIYNRLQAGDKAGAGLSAAATGLGMAVPVMGPLAGAAVGLYDDPEARKKFLESMQPEGAWQRRMEGRFGLD